MPSAPLLQYSQQQAYGHNDRVFDVQFHPATSLVLASASEDCTVRVWRRDLDSGKHKQVVCCYGHEAEVLRLGWSLDGRLLASGSADNTVRIWEAPLDGVIGQGTLPPAPSYNAKQVALLSGHPEEVYHCEFVIPGTPTPPPCTTASDAATPLAAVNGSVSGAGSHTSWSDMCDLGPGSHLLAASSESLLLWDLQEGVLTQQADAPGTSGSTMPSEAVTSGYKHAYIFACCRQPTHASRGQQGGQLLACACSDGVLRMWALVKSGLQYVGCRELTAGGGAATLTAMAWDAGGTRLAVAVKDGTVLVLDARQQLRVCHSFRLPCSALTAATLPPTSPLLATHDGVPNQEWLLLGCSDGRLRLCPWQADSDSVAGTKGTLAELSPQPPGSGFSMLALAISASADTLAMAGTATSQLPAPATDPAPMESATRRSPTPPPAADTDKANDRLAGIAASEAQNKPSNGSAATKGVSGVMQAAVAAPSRRRRGSSAGGQGPPVKGTPGDVPGVAALQALDQAVHGMHLDLLPDRPQQPQQAAGRQDQAGKERTGQMAGVQLGQAAGLLLAHPEQGAGLPGTETEQGAGLPGPPLSMLDSVNEADGMGPPLNGSEAAGQQTQPSGHGDGHAAGGHAGGAHGQRQEPHVRAPVFIWCSSSTTLDP